MPHSPTPQRLKMYMKSPGRDNVSLSLTFLGKKIHSCIDPAVKPSTWETTALPSNLEASMPGSGPGHSQNLIFGPEELPGSVPHLREDVPPESQCTVHSTRLDKDTESDSWLKKNKVGWNVFKQWMRADRKIGLQARDVMRAGEKREEEDASLKIFIPYDSAKLCVTQIIEDMEFMKRRHLEIVNELEESYINAAKNNQEKIIQKVNAHYQNKLISLRRMLDVYQEMAEKKNIYCEERIKTLKNRNQKHLEEKTALQEKNQADAAKWEREKLEMLELFSTRLDLLHKHQASTLQELQMARQELGSIQVMLKPTCANEEINVTSVMRTDLLQPETEDGGESESCGGSGELTLEGAQARLETLKENLYKREREITELLQGEREMEREQTLITAIRIPCTALLRTIIQKAHDIYQNVAEAQLLVDHMAEDNGLELAQAKEVPDQEQMTTTNHRHQGEDEPEWERLTEEQHRRCTSLQKTEAVHIALECIKKGLIPSLSDGTWKLEHNCSGPDEEHCQVLENNNFRIKSLGQQLLQLQTEFKQAREETKRITENYNSERTMRKKYFNMVEDMKGKIRVFCRIRPMSEAETSCGSIPVVDCLDDYSVTVETSRGLKEFQFDRVFNPTSSQEDVFQDISRLIQSAIDGYNVCIFAYGQTGSGKTFTMVGDKDLKNPGIMPRTFRTIFHITQENSSKFDFKVSMCMLELYNERLLDLFVSPVDALGKRIEIKKDRKGLVIAHGAETKDAASAEELLALFEQGCCNRHIAATKMNMESSRSHLIVGITMESRNHTNGCVSYGKLSLVDLAGSERVAKTGAKDEQLKEANSINKSLSALGDVIFALSTEQVYVPYRNNKLTQFMQDSLGGNAKTLMFVNISPASCNTEETLTSLSYATRVKAITNTAQKNSESKEIAHLKEIILKLKSGQPVDDDV
ncbi:uncharacterized protein [Paramormyrops kingsleyae]|uniref:uncharacterized protein isoform X3 n=1 Tax=Paramormyrops kingsleyae TaxID=1676925 RepID=UPI000CD66DE6|nr:kinesin-like protein KIN-14E isoform X3 [Paramormyrops kingsleyae]